MLAVPPAQGANFVRVVDSDGCISRVFRSSECTEYFGINWGVLLAFVIGWTREQLPDDLPLGRNARRGDLQTR